MRKAVIICTKTNKIIQIVLLITLTLLGVGKYPADRTLISLELYGIIDVLDFALQTCQV